MLLNSEIFHVSTAKEFNFRVLRAREIGRTHLRAALLERFWS